MDNIVYIIDNAGHGPVLGYEKQKYEKLQATLKKSGYRLASIEELKKFKNIEVLEKEKPKKIKSSLTK